MNRFHRFDVLCAWYKEYATVKGFRPRTVHEYLLEVAFFRRWLEKQTEVQDIDEITPAMVRDFATVLYDKKKAPATIRRNLTSLKSFFSSLYAEHKLYIDLSTAVSLPRIGKKLPTDILTEEEAGKIIDHLESLTSNTKVRTLADAIRLRDHAIFEVLYSTGIRRGELMALRLGDVNYSDGLITIKQGKGGKDRVVPIGEKSLEIVRRYVTSARGMFAQGKSPDALFLTSKGASMGRMTVRETVMRIVREAGITRHVKTHGIRHTCATHMLNHGADIRYVQELLGHSCLSSTQVYTHVSIKQLKESHRKFHPREREEFSDDEAPEESDEQKPAAKGKTE
jgi:integrase/recombinase XerD